MPSSYHTAIGIGLGVGFSLVSMAAAQTVTDPRLRVSEVVSGLSQPTAMAFIGPGDILVLQKAMGELDELSMGCFSPSKYLTLQLTILRSLQSSTTMSSSREMSSLSSVSTRARLARTRWRSLKTVSERQADLALCLGIRQSQAAGQRGSLSQNVGG
jgi:glucose/arabinose dehydrogenase